MYDAVNDSPFLARSLTRDDIFSRSTSCILFIHSPNKYVTAMRLSLRLLANPTAVGSTQGLKPAPLALLPPIPLYRRLFRSHRNFLPKEMRVLGDQYIKSEFRSHREVENPMHIVDHPPVTLSSGSADSCLQIGFLTEWQMYAQKIEGDAWKGEKLDKGKIDKMSGMLVIMEISVTSNTHTSRSKQISSWDSFTSSCKRSSRQAVRKAVKIHDCHSMLRSECIICQP